MITTCAVVHNFSMYRKACGKDHELDLLAAAVTFLLERTGLPGSWRVRRQAGRRRPTLQGDRPWWRCRPRQRQQAAQALGTGPAARLAVRPPRACWETRSPGAPTTPHWPAGLQSTIQSIRKLSQQVSLRILQREGCVMLWQRDADYEVSASEMCHPCLDAWRFMI